MFDREQLESWLAATNRRYRDEGIGHASRPWRAVSDYSVEFRCSFMMGSDLDRFIFEWFEKRSKSGIQSIGSLYEGIFFYDTCFWEMRIPIGFGGFSLNLADCLDEMPDPVKADLCAEMQVNPCIMASTMEHWANCIDYAYGLSDIAEGRAIHGIGLERLMSADQELRGANRLLTGGREIPKCILSYRLSVEIFLKAIGWQEGIITSEDQERKKYSHKLEKLARACAEKTGGLIFDEIAKEASVFPAWDARYEDVTKDNHRLWRAAFLAQSTAAETVKLYSGRNVKSQICPWASEHKPSKGTTPPDP